jgi:hypothetical protein
MAYVVDGRLRRVGRKRGRIKSLAPGLLEVCVQHPTDPHTAIRALNLRHPRKARNRVEWVPVDVEVGNGRVEVVVRPQGNLSIVPRDVVGLLPHEHIVVGDGLSEVALFGPNSPNKIWSVSDSRIECCEIDGWHVRVHAAQCRA